MGKSKVETKSESVLRCVLFLGVFPIALIFLLFLLVEAPFGAEDRLAYYSDYFSFVGADDEGRVAFAIDTNRGQDGDEFQAEHFVVLHDEHLDWQSIEGTGSYPNSSGMLDGISDSRYFQFIGTPEKGVVIESSVNNMTLSVQPISMHLSRRVGNQDKRLGSAPATLEWRGRTLEGRAIYEFVHFDNWNRLTRTYWDYWRDFGSIWSWGIPSLRGAETSTWPARRLIEITRDDANQTALPSWTGLKSD